MAMHLILSDQEMQHLQIRKIQDHKWSRKAPLSFLEPQYWPPLCEGAFQSWLTVWL